MNLLTILKEIQAHLDTNDSSVPVYREEYVPSNLGAKREDGYITWSFSADYFVETSEFYSGTVEGDLDIISYARTRPTRDTLYTNVLDLWLPEVEGKRTSYGPMKMGDAFLHFSVLEDVSELFAEKTGHDESETPGIITTFRIKISA